jgi:hypothetical protein
MSASGDDNFQEADALTRRLAALRDRPVDLSRLERTIKAAVPPPEPVVLPHPTLFWRRKAWSIAASVLLLISVGVTGWYSLAPHPALAAPQLLENIHDQALAMRHIRVSSFEEAGRALAREWRSGPDLPVLDGVVPMECCMHKVGSKVVKCVSLDVDGEKVVMVVGRDKDIQAPEGQVMMANGQKVVLTSSNGVNMAMSEHDGRWICLMGRIDGARLVELAGSIR